MKSKNYLILLMSALLFAMCTKDDLETCPEEIDVGYFDLLESSKDLFPYLNEEMKIVFSDSLGNEVTASTSGTSVKYNYVYSPSVKCLDDSTSRIFVSAHVESKSTSLNIEDLGLKFNIRFSVHALLSNYRDKLSLDRASITAERLILITPAFFNPIPQMIFEIDKRNSMHSNSNQVLPDSSITINMREYFDVYTNQIGRDAIEIYYNHHKGIVGFRDKATGNLYGFERIE